MKKRRKEGKIRLIQDFTRFHFHFLLSIVICTHATFQHRQRSCNNPPTRLYIVLFYVVSFLTKRPSKTACVEEPEWREGGRKGGNDEPHERGWEGEMEDGRVGGNSEPHGKGREGWEGGK